MFLPKSESENSSIVTKEETFFFLSPTATVVRIMFNDGENLFIHLPEELFYNVVQYMDVPSISTLSIAFGSPSSHFQNYLQNDTLIWQQFVKKRFCIQKGRPKAYGGVTWKQVYKILSKTDRIPRCKFTTRNAHNNKTIFAKPMKKIKFVSSPASSLLTPRSFDTRAGTTASFVKKRDHNVDVTNYRHRCMGLKVWCSVSHTDDCNTRLFQPPLTGAERDSLHFDFTRYITLRLCVQNTKSGSEVAEIDFTQTFVQILGRNDYHHDNRSSTDDSSTSSPKLEVVPVLDFPSYYPKILYVSGKDNVESDDKLYDHTYNEFHHNRTKKQRKHHNRNDSSWWTNDNIHDKDSKPSAVVKLKAFQFAVVKVCVPCHRDMIYETDFLSRALLIHVRAQMSIEIPLRLKDDDSKKKENKNNHGKMLKFFRESHYTLATASFLSENQIWEHYMELPGGMLALQDSTHLFNV